MSFKILYVTATTAESSIPEEDAGMMSAVTGPRKLELSSLVTGVGSISTAWALNHWITLNGRPDLAINGGIAGSYKDELVPGDVVMPVSDCFADAGIEDENIFLTLSEAGLISADEFPYKGGLLYTDIKYKNKMKGLLKPVRAITLNTATGSEITREKLLKKFNPDIETMEGATFFYICSRENIPFLAMRAISNRVGARNKNNWKIDLAIKNLTEKLRDILLTL
jgi:futalosine hydrolase